MQRDSLKRGAAYGILRTCKRFVDPWTALLAGGSLLALLLLKLNSLWLVLIGAIAGLLIHGFGR